MFDFKTDDLCSKTDKLLYNIYELLRENNLLLHSMRKSTAEKLEMIPAEKPEKFKTTRKSPASKTKTKSPAKKPGTRKYTKKKKEE